MIHRFHNKDILSFLNRRAASLKMDDRADCRNMKRLRQSRKMSLEPSAENGGLTKGDVSKIENAHKAPPVSTWTKIARALNAGMGVLLADKSKPPKINLHIVKKWGKRSSIECHTLIATTISRSLTRRWASVWKQREDKPRTIPEKGPSSFFGMMGGLYLTHRSSYMLGAYSAYRMTVYRVYRR